MEPPATPQFKDRRGGLILFGVLEILLGGLCLLLVPVVFLGQKLQADMTGQPADYKTAVPAALIYLPIAVVFVWLGIGSIRCRRWAQTLTLFVAWTWLIVGVVSIAALAFIAPQIASGQADSPLMGIGIVVVGVVLSVVFVVVPGAMVLFYRSPHVRATCEARDPKVRWTDACPLPVLGASLSFALGAVSFFAMPLGYKAVFPLFGTLVKGPVAFTLLVAMGAVWLWLAWGIYRMSVAAWLASIGVIVVLGVSTTVTMLRVDVLDLYREMGYPEQQVEQLAQFGLMTRNTSAAWTAISFLLFLGYMLWVRKHFRPAA